jgi:elongation factor P
MPPVSTSDFKNGITLDIPEGLMQIIDFQHVKPGKGGAFVRTKMRNIRTGAVLERTYNAGEKMEQAIIDNRDMQYLYKAGEDFVFMDTTSYEQLEVSLAQLGEAIDYLKENDNALVRFYGDEIVGLELPAAVELVIKECEPGIQGDRVSGAKKPATLETGKVIQVPLFVNQGEKVKVDTRTGDYITRV